MYFSTSTPTLFSTILFSAILALPLQFVTVKADFHYGQVDYAVTTATGRYYEILPAHQTTCLKAYDFYPKAAYGFNPPAEPLIADICGKEIVLNTTSGEWYTHGRIIESGTCNFINGTSGTRTASCQTAAFESAATYLDLLSCPSDICKGCAK